MYIFKKKSTLSKYLSLLRNTQSLVGYVPTMGALHAGHIQLVRKAVSQNEITICTIFVNPTQFNEEQDFENYPVQLEKDIQKITEAGVSILYLPQVCEIYPDGTEQLEQYDFGGLEEKAEGLHRPGHFQGVGQVLSRLLRIIHPDRMYMGQKDYQQLLITRKLMKTLRLQTEVVSVPTQREKDGLAMSSRNLRLSEEGRNVAPAIYKVLCSVRDRRNEIPLEGLLQKAIRTLKEKGIKVEYLMLADADTLEPAGKFTTRPQVLLIAAWLHGIRLIDNVLLKA